MSEKIKTAVIEVIKAHMVGEDKNTKVVLSDVMQSVNEILEQQPCEDKCHYCEHNFTPYKGNTGEFTEQQPCDDALIQLKKYTEGKQNTDKVEISVLTLNRIIKALSQEPCDDAISRNQSNACSILSLDRKSVV